MSVVGRAMASVRPVRSRSAYLRIKLQSLTNVTVGTDVRASSSKVRDEESSCEPRRVADWQRGSSRLT